MERIKEALTTCYQLELFESNLPGRPYCTDDLGCLFIRLKDNAIKRRYIQPNKPPDLRWFLYDMDTENAALEWQDRNAPTPNIIVLNPDNGHGHYFYGLECPVFTQDGTRINPYRYAAAVDVALTGQLKADPGYSKLIAKNPLNKHWKTLYPYDLSYDLKKLSEHLDMNFYREKNRIIPDIGLGRNCNLFDKVRKRAYAMIREQGFKDLSVFNDRVLEMAGEYNMDFINPLAYCEVKSLAKSVSKWVMKNFSEIGLRQWAANRGHSGGLKSGVTRLSTALEKKRIIEKAKAINPGASQRELSSLTGISQQSISYLLKLTNEAISDDSLLDGLFKVS